MDVEEAKSCDELCEMMNTDEFIVGKQWYRRKNYDNSIFWEDRGQTILNTAHIGKVQEFLDLEERNHDESQGTSGSMRRNNESTRGRVWSSKGEL
jgi:hypothetical protein